jgi:tRNA (guanine-N7-)-methyltransferase
MSSSGPVIRHVRSFVRRGGRITVAQSRALRDLWPRYGIDHSADPLELDTRFGRRAPRVLEIGFGNGDTLLALAAANPERDYLGIEVHEPGVGRVLLRAHEAGLANVRLICHDAVEVLAQLPDASLDEVLVFFPDPWPKKRHHKRRLIQQPFAALLARKLRSRGVLRLATDWEDYARQMLEVLASLPELRNCSGDDTFVARPDSRPPTRFEKRGQRLGHGVWDLEFRRL